MGKTLYICYMDLGNNGTIGIIKKVKSQINLLQRNAVDEIAYIYREKGQLITNIDGIEQGLVCRKAEDINAILLSSLNELAVFDKIYIRFNHLTIKFIKLLKRLASNKARIVMEIPTYPFVKEDFEELFLALKRARIIVSVKVFFKIIENAVLSLFLKRYISRIITYSNDNKIWGIDTIKISNGIEIREIDINSCDSSLKDSTINLVCVSSCLKWHGYDRIIEGIYRYYQEAHTEAVHLYIVGDGPEISNYKKMISKYDIENHITITGILNGNELDQLYEKADVAFDALGRHRVGVYFNSSLKGKEYAERGIPIVSGVKTEFDLDNSFRCYYRVPADDSYIDIEKVLSFIETVKTIPTYKKAIREYAINHFSYDVAMKGVVDYFFGEKETN